MAENYLVVGDDEYIKEREIRKIRDRFLPSKAVSFNYSAHSPSDMAGIKDSLSTLPFLSDKRVVLLEDAEGLADDSVGGILDYLANPCDTGVLVISAGGAFKKTGHYKKLSRLMKTVNADEPAPWAMKKYVKDFFKKEGINISGSAVDLIVELKGADTSAVRSELEKLTAYADDNKIDVGDVEKLVGRSVTEVIFKLVDAINARDAEWAFRVLGDLYNQKKTPTEIIGYLTWYIRLLAKVKLFSAKGLSADAQAMELRYSAAYVRRLKDQAKKYSGERVKRWTALLLQTDQDIKSGAKSPSVAMDMLIAALLGDVPFGDTPHS